MILFVAGLIESKKETHREYHFNSTTIHYLVKRAVVLRCDRCSRLHDYFYRVGARFGWLMVIPALTAVLCYRYSLDTPIRDDELAVWIWPGAFFFFVGALVVMALAVLVRWIATMVATPRDERRYWDVSTSQAYGDMKRDGFHNITVNARRDAFNTVLKTQSAKS
jgi:hypothetical protein